MNNYHQISKINFSLIITAHEEELLLVPTLNAAKAGLEELINFGIEVEAVLILDKASIVTSLIATQWQEKQISNFKVTIQNTKHGESGAARNTGVEISSGEVIGFCDGDDLFSKSYLLNGYLAAIKEETPTIFHPEIVLSFGAVSNIWEVKGNDNEEYSYKDLIESNLWPSSSIAKRIHYLSNPFLSLSPKFGFGPEDWMWNIETTINGLKHEIISETIFCYRTSLNSGVNNQHKFSLLPYINIKALEKNFPSKIYASKEPSRKIIDVFKNYPGRIYRKFKPTIQKLISFLSPEAKGFLYRQIAKPYRFLLKIEDKKPSIVSTDLIEQLLSLCEIEPSISWSAYNYGNLEKWLPKNTGYSDILLHVLKQLENKSKSIVFVPWIGIGGADLVSLNYLRALNSSDKFFDSVSAIATYTPSKTMTELIPEGLNFVQMPEQFRDLSPQQQRRLIAQLFIQAQPELALSINCFDVTNSLQLFSSQISSVTNLYLSLFAFDKIGAGFPVNPITDDPQRHYLNEIKGIITDNSVTQKQIINMLGLSKDFVKVHDQPAFVITPEFRQYTAAYDDWEFSEEYPFRLIWPHRIDKEKRPEVLVQIASMCKKNQIPIEITIFGQKVLSGKDDELFSKFREVGIIYAGPYAGGIKNLPLRDFHAMLLTSESEGMPLAVVQAMLLGMPVISTAVGGVPDLIQDSESGMLTKGPEDIEGFVGAIVKLIESRELRRRIIQNAYDAAKNKHSWESFTKLIDQAF